jgi:hypothetical protein
MGRKKKIINPDLYVDDDELVYEIKLSQGKGFLTEKAKVMFIKIVNNFMFNFKGKLGDIQIQDCSQHAVLHLLTNWESFNTKKYYKAIPYFTELVKRAVTWEYNELEKNAKFNISIHNWLK